MPFKLVVLSLAVTTLGRGDTSIIESLDIDSQVVIKG